MLILFCFWILAGDTIYALFFPFFAVWTPISHCISPVFLSGMACCSPCGGLGCSVAQLFVPLRPVMCRAEHCTIANISCATVAPCRYMVRIHFLQLVYSMSVIIIPQGAQGAIGDALGLSSRGLPIVNRPLCYIIKDANIEQFCIHTSAEDLFKYPSSVLYIIVRVER